jgi:iron-sulfur cluster repair protein YtfE (RIC family)
MSVLKLLKEDHQKVIKILGQLSESSQLAIKIRKQGFDQLVQELTIHTTFEEQILYPALKKNAKIKDMIFEAYEEHHFVDFIIREMQQLPVNAETWLAKLSVLEENLKHHIKEEEKSLFPKAKLILSENTQNQMEIQLKEYKAKSSG